MGMSMPERHALVNPYDAGRTGPDPVPDAGRPRSGAARRAVALGVLTAGVGVAGAGAASAEPDPFDLGGDGDFSIYEGDPLPTSSPDDLEPPLDVDADPGFGLTTLPDVALPDLEEVAEPDGTPSPTGTPAQTPPGTPVGDGTEVVGGTGPAAAPDATPAAAGDDLTTRPGGLTPEQRQLLIDRLLQQAGWDEPATPAPVAPADVPADVSAIELPESDPALSAGLASGELRIGTPLLGSGKYGNVYPLEGAPDGVDLAIKILKPQEQLTRPGMLQREAGDTAVLTELGFRTVNPRYVAWEYPETGVTQEAVVVDLHEGSVHSHQVEDFLELRAQGRSGPRRSTSTPSARRRWPPSGRWASSPPGPGPASGTCSS